MDPIANSGSAVRPVSAALSHSGLSAILQARPKRPVEIINQYLENLEAQKLAVVREEA